MTNGETPHLTKCIVCAGNVSSAATACPHCGHPMPPLAADAPEELTKKMLKSERASAQAHVETLFDQSGWRVDARTITGPGIGTIATDEVRQVVIKSVTLNHRQSTEWLRWLWVLTAGASVLGTYVMCSNAGSGFGLPGTDHETGQLGAMVALLGFAGMFAAFILGLLLPTTEVQVYTVLISVGPDTWEWNTSDLALAKTLSSAIEEAMRATG